MNKEERDMGEDGHPNGEIPARFNPESGSPKITASPLDSNPAPVEDLNVNMKSQDPVMEAHHHGHHKEKKNLREYLQEGLMIFVAVTLGFFAENVREYIHNLEKEKAYIFSYLHNLREDSANLHQTVDLNKTKLVFLDSIMNLAVRGISTPVNRERFYRYCSGKTASYAEFKNNDATFLQLTNADGLRLIRKNHAADSIASYAAHMKIIYASEGLYAQATHSAVESVQEVIDNSVFYDNRYYTNGQFTNKLIPFITDDPKKLKWLFNRISLERAATQSYIDNLQELDPKLTRLIEFLQNAYPGE